METDQVEFVRAKMIHDTVPAQLVKQVAAVPLSACQFILRPLVITRNKNASGVPLCIFFIEKKILVTVFDDCHLAQFDLPIVMIAID